MVRPGHPGFSVFGWTPSSGQCDLLACSALRTEAVGESQPRPRSLWVPLLERGHVFLPLLFFSVVLGEPEVPALVGRRVFSRQTPDSSGSTVTDTRRSDVYQPGLRTAASWGSWVDRAVTAVLSRLHPGATGGTWVPVSPPQCHAFWSPQLCSVSGWAHTRPWKSIPAGHPLTTGL